MAVLITGGSGFVGINIIEKLLDENLNVVNYATFPVPEEAEISFERRQGTYQFMEGDVLDATSLDDVMEKYDISMVIHGAVITPDFKQEKANSKHITNVNYMGTIEVLEAARRHQVKKFIYISSVSVYGDAAFEDEVLHETQSVPIPRTLYEITKYAAESTALRYKTLFGMEVMVTRVGQVFGPWERYTGIRHTPSGPFQATRNALLNREIKMPRPGVRDWVYSRDVAEVIWRLLQKHTYQYDIYNIGPGHQWTIEQWCDLLQQEIPNLTYSVAAQEDMNIDFFVPVDAGMLAIERLNEDLDFQPQYSMEEAFKDYMEWIATTSDFWLSEST
ncbi:NAD-dependent epimerase/dehydratase family protein [Gracilibacillus massiliensis]|uniref:NAD-dependent epimerase/dehydratase family protein n=1 Tax=Gracilibacillus massiliensis TaxID=1564956 RepID=UPI00071E333C|nr:NAD(P)-dependent oxidoreductase [Gracilibacillus massiliensis]